MIQFILSIHSLIEPGSFRGLVGLSGPRGTGSSAAHRLLLRNSSIRPPEISFDPRWSGGGVRGITQTLDGPFSALSKPIFATEG